MFKIVNFLENCIGKDDWQCRYIRDRCSYVSPTKQDRKTCALWGFRWCLRISGDRGEFEFRPHKGTIKSNKIFGDRKGGRDVANDNKHFKNFCNSVVSVTVEIELTSLKVPRDL
jgi:hypothetical protein